VRLIEIRLLDGPNIYRLEPVLKIEVALGRRRTWFGQRIPDAHHRVDLGAAVRPSEAPTPIARLQRWVEVLHRHSRAAAWLADEGRATSPARARIPVAIHRTSEPGHWIVAFPWREDARAQAIAEAALAFTEASYDPATTRPATRRTVGMRGRSRQLARTLVAIATAGGAPPGWIRDADRRMPVISISGTNGKTTTTRMIAHVLRAAGRHVGSTTSDGVTVDERLVEPGDLTGPYGARAVLTRDDVDVAVLETARGGIMLRGVGYESDECAVLTNVSSDHMDLQGIHTLPELTQVKAVIARITRSDGVVVLNADDDLVAGVARLVRAPVWLTSMRPTGRRISRCLARGGRAYVLDGPDLVELEGAERRRIVAASDVPATLGGLARHNIANALSAAAGARAMGATIEQVAAGLGGFGASLDARYGRLDLYRRGDTTVVVDFAHNEAGVAALVAVGEGLAGDRASRAGSRCLAIIIGSAGDRPDDTLRGIGRIAAEHVDRVVIKEMLHYLRGRTRESVVGELRAGIASGGGDPNEVPVRPDEPSAIRSQVAPDGTIADTGLPGVLLVLCHEDRAGVVRTLEELGFEPVTSADG
jgi:cyanophycin synthetase